MSELLRLTEEKNKIIEQFLEITELISNCLSTLETDEQLKEIEGYVKRRDVLISKANGLTEQMQGMPIVESEYTQLEKLRSISNDLLRRTQMLEKQNIVKMNETLKGFMKKVKTTRQSIKVIDAYTQSDGVTTGGLINKRN